MTRQYLLHKILDGGYINALAHCISCLTASKTMVGSQDRQSMPTLSLAVGSRLYCCHWDAGKCSTFLLQQHNGKKYDFYMMKITTDGILNDDK